MWLGKKYKNLERSEGVVAEINDEEVENILKKACQDIEYYLSLPLNINKTIET